MGTVGTIGAARPAGPAAPAARASAPGTGADLRQVQRIVRGFLRDGDIGQATATLGSAIGAMPAAPSRPLAVARTGLALVRACAGDIGEANRLLAAAQDAFEELDPPAPEWALAHAGVGAIAAWRGEAHAEVELERAVATARALGDEHLEAIVRVVRAEVTAGSQARRAHVDARFAARVFHRAGDDELAVWAERARAAAAHASREHRAASLIAQRLLGAPLNPLERGRTQLVLARAARALGDDVAAATALHDAVEHLARAGASWFLVDALLLLAEAEPGQAGAHLARARGLTRTDPAYAVRWAARPALTIEVLGAQRLQLGGETLAFRSTKTLKLLLCLALAGPRGRDVDALAAQLWPTASNPRHNITTATWDARQGLGGESWRLQREGTRLALDLAGARVDLDDLIALATRPPAPSASPAQHLAWRDALAALHRPVLPAWAYEDWVIAADTRRATVAATLTATLTAHVGDAPTGSAPR